MLNLLLENFCIFEQYCTFLLICLELVRVCLELQRYLQFFFNRLMVIEFKVTETIEHVFGLRNFYMQNSNSLRKNFWVGHELIYYICTIFYRTLFCLISIFTKNCKNVKFHRPSNHQAKIYSLFYEKIMNDKRQDKVFLSLISLTSNKDQLKKTSANLFRFELDEHSQFRKKVNLFLIDFSISNH